MPSFLIEASPDVLIPYERGDQISIPTSWSIVGQMILPPGSDLEYFSEFGPKTKTGFLGSHFAWSSVTTEAAF